jgi:hypothetical protein
MHSGLSDPAVRIGDGAGTLGSAGAPEFARAGTMDAVPDKPEPGPL